MNLWQKLKVTPWIAVWPLALGSSLTAAPFLDLSFEAATNQAARSGKIVLVDFYTTWCAPCKLLDKNTWTDPAVIKLLQQKTVALRIDAEKEVALSKRYKIDAYPTVLLVKPDGTEIDRLVGYREPKTFTNEFTAALAGKDSVRRARDALTSAGTNDPSARMQYGVALAQKGKDSEALAEYLWCFDHGVEASRAFVGVRLSFLLSYIKDLGSRYPAALQALETRRDERQDRVAAGSTDFATIQELVALNTSLEQPEKNLAVFDRLPAGSRTKDMILPLLIEQLLQAKRYSDVIQGPDAKSSFNKVVDQYNKTLASLGKDSPIAKRVGDSLRQLTITSGAHSFEALAGLKRNQDAKDLAGEILKFDSSDATRATLAKAARRAENAELTQYVSK
jgi:thiol-disulfide isomerase/thioredoxin